MTTDDLEVKIDKRDKILTTHFAQEIKDILDGYPYSNYKTHGYSMTSGYFTAMARAKTLVADLFTTLRSLPEESEV